MQFNYIAKTRQGEDQSGVVEANSERSAIETLQSRGLFVLRIQSASAKPLASREIKFFQRVKDRELVGFSLQLSTLVSAQVPLLAALQALAKQTENAYFREIIFKVANDVEGGMVFSRALARHPRAFSNFFVNMVMSGEASGNLEKSLSYLAVYLERQNYLLSRVRGAMTYPAFIFGSFMIIGALMMILVVPKLTTFLQSTGVELPLTTKIVIGLSNFLRGWWWLLLIVLVGGGLYLFWSIRTSPAMHRRWDILKLKIPVFGKKIFQKMYVARFAENLSTLIQGGLTILQSLQITADVVGNVVFRDIILEAKEEVRVGSSLSAALAKHKEIPPLVCQMIGTGEQTGSMDVILKKMAGFYSREIDTTVDSLTQLIEPVLILFLGGSVALLVAAILMPIYSVTSSF